MPAQPRAGRLLSGIQHVQQPCGGDDAMARVEQAARLRRSAARVEPRFVGEAMHARRASAQADHFQVASECSSPCGGEGCAGARGDGMRSPAFCVPVSAARTLSYMLLRALQPGQPGPQMARWPARTAADSTRSPASSMPVSMAHML